MPTQTHDLVLLNTRRQNHFLSGILFQTSFGRRGAHLFLDSWREIAGLGVFMALLSFGEV
jgi:hypothetical protein